MQFEKAHTLLSFRRKLFSPNLFTTLLFFIVRLLSVNSHESYYHKQIRVKSSFNQIEIVHKLTKP